MAKGMKCALALISILVLLSSRNVLAAETYANYQTYLSTIGLSTGTDIDLGKGVLVAVIDGGVWQNHPDIDGNIWTNFSETRNNNIDDDANGYVDDYYGWNFIDDNYDGTAKDSHGTAIASIIAAEINNEGIAGIAPAAQIMALTACDAEACPWEEVSEAMYYAVDNGADIINLSLGSTGYYGYDTDLDAAISYAYSHDVIVVASAGNGDVESSGTMGQNLTRVPASPVCNDIDGYNTVVGVGATNAEWSNYGDCVDLTAPGESIAAAIVPEYEEGYYYSSGFFGTSFSAPMVSAALAAVKSEHPTLKNYEIIDRVISTTTDGVLNVSAALAANPWPEISGVSVTTVAAGATVEVSGAHFTTSWTPLLQGVSQTISVDTSTLVVHDSQHMMLTIPSSTPVGTYTLTIKNNTSKKSASFTVTAATSSSSVASADVDSASSTDSETVESSGSDVSLLGGQYSESKKDVSLIERLLGSILLQVNEHGEAWYVNPTDSLRYYMKDGATAYGMMRSFGLGITDKDLEEIPSAEDSTSVKLSTSVCATNTIANRLKGRILIQVEQHGEAWYIEPETCTRVYMKDGAAAYSIMRELGLGIANTDLEKLPDGEVAGT